MTKTGIKAGASVMASKKKAYILSFIIFTL